MYELFIYRTTSFKDKTPIITSREETVSNVVTPGVDDVPTKSADSLIEPTIATIGAREGKQNNDIDLEPTEIFEIELTTYFTTYT